MCSNELKDLLAALEMKVPATHGNEIVYTLSCAELLACKVHLRELAKAGMPAAEPAIEQAPYLPARCYE